MIFRTEQWKDEHTRERSVVGRSLSGFKNSSGTGTFQEWSPALLHREDGVLVLMLFGKEV